MAVPEFILLTQKGGSTCVINTQNIASIVVKEEETRVYSIGDEVNVYIRVRETPEDIYNMLMFDQPEKHVTRMEKILAEQG